MKKKKKTWNQTGRKKGVRVLSTKQSENKESIKDIKKAIKDGGLKLSWIRFIDELLANGGKQAKAYKKVFSSKEKTVTDGTARTEASRLMRNPNILAELNNRLEVQRCTDDFVKNGLIDIATNYRGHKTINAAVRSLEVLAKIKGMLIDNKKVAFTSDNPALFLPVYNKEDKKKFDKMKNNNERLVE